MSASQYPLNIWVESQNQYAPSVAFPLPVNVVGGNLVSQIIPGTGVTISPTTGIGAVTINATGTTGGVTGIEDGTTNVVTGAVQIKSADTNLTVVGNPTTNVMTLTNAAPCNATTVSAAGFSTTTQMNSAIATALGNYLELGVTSPTTIGETVLAGNNAQNAFVVTQAGTGLGQTVNNTGGGSGIGITTANNYSLNLTNRTSTSVNYQPEILGHTSVGSAGSLNGCATTLVWPIEASTTPQTLTLPAGGGQILSATNMASYMPTQIIAGTGVTVSPTTGIGAVTINATGTTGGVTGIEDGTTNVVTGAVQIKSADTNLTVLGNPTTNVMTLTNAAPCNATTVSAAGFSTTTQMNSAIATALGNYLELGVTNPTTTGTTVLAGNNAQNAVVVTQAGTGAGQTVNNTGGGSGIGITTANNYSLNLTNRTSMSVNYQPEILGHTSVGSAGSLNGCATTLVWPIEASTTPQTLTLPAGGGQILSATNMASYMPTLDNSSTPITTFSTDTHVPSSKNVYDNTINPVVTTGGDFCFSFDSRNVSTHGDSCWNRDWWHF